jgi:hypothetical protein
MAAPCDRDIAQVEATVTDRAADPVSARKLSQAARSVVIFIGTHPADGFYSFT